MYYPVSFNEKKFQHFSYLEIVFMLPMTFLFYGTPPPPNAFVHRFFILKILNFQFFFIIKFIKKKQRKTPQWPTSYWFRGYSVNQVILLNCKCSLYINHLSKDRFTCPVSYHQWYWGLLVGWDNCSFPHQWSMFKEFKCWQAVHKNIL